MHFWDEVSTLNSILTAAGGSIVGFGGLIWTVLNKRFKNQKIEQQLHQRQQQRDEELHQAQLELLKQASLATLHSQLYDKGERYIKSGHISLAQLDDIKYTWLPYSGLGGNGTGEMIYNKCLQLPIADYEADENWREVEELAKQHMEEK